MAPPRGKEPRSDGLRSAGLLLAIPTLLIASPLVGLFLGRAVDRWLGITPWGTALGVLLGFVAAGREIYLIVRKVQSEEENQGRR